MEQELSVMKWVEERRVGVSVTNAEDAASFSRENLALMRMNVEALPENLAVYEVSKLLEEMLEVPRRSLTTPSLPSSSSLPAKTRIQPNCTTPKVAMERA